MTDRTLRDILDKNDEEALELAYLLAEKMMDRPITPEQERMSIFVSCTLGPHRIAPRFQGGREP